MKIPVIFKGDGLFYSDRQLCNIVDMTTVKNDDGSYSAKFVLDNGVSKLYDRKASELEVI
ncbi:MAG: hypothetical protein ACFFG0_03760 [Candidatus Thorarchaeota archaeon]